MNGVISDNFTGVAIPVPQPAPTWLSVLVFISCSLIILSLAYFSRKKPRLLLIMPVVVWLPLSIILAIFFLGFVNRFSQIDVRSLLIFSTLFASASGLIISALFSLSGFFGWFTARKRQQSNLLARRRMIFGLISAVLTLGSIVAFNVIFTSLGLGSVYY